MSPTCEAMSVNPGPMRTKMRAAAMPGEDPMTLRTPEEFAPKLADLCAPDWTADRQDLRFPHRHGLSFQGPA